MHDFGVSYGYTHTGQKNHIKKSANRLTFPHWDVPMRKRDFIVTFTVNGSKVISQPLVSPLTRKN